MPRKLKLLATHSFRTSAAIFKDQMRRAGLDEAIADLVEIVYIDAPNPASGPIPDDVAPFFQGPYYEWWNAMKDEERGVWTYRGWERTVAKLQDVVQLHGPFDGVMGFSQGAAVASLLVGLQRSGRLLQDQPQLKFCVLFAGIRVRAKVRGDTGELDCIDQIYEAMKGCPSLHVIGDRDPIKRMTNDLIASFHNPVVINHPKGHVIPALQGAELQRLRAFLESHAQESSLYAQELLLDHDVALVLNVKRDLLFRWAFFARAVRCRDSCSSTFLL